MTLTFRKKKIKTLSTGSETLLRSKTKKVAGGISAIGCGPISNPNYSCPVSINTYSCN